MIYNLTFVLILNYAWAMTILEKKKVFICNFANFNLELVQLLVAAFAYPCLWSGKIAL